MRRGIGVSAVTKKNVEKKQYEAVGKKMDETRMSNVKETLNKFQNSLADFAEKHRDKINSDPEFRQQFHAMCLNVGVDPLSSNKGFWADILGVGNFYFELGIIIIQICLQTRSVNGGIISLSNLLERVAIHRKRSKQQASLDDLKKAIEKLGVLGKGYQLIKFRGKEPYLLSVPIELNRDHEELMSIAQENDGCISLQLLTQQQSPTESASSQSVSCSYNNWSAERFSLAINSLLVEGIVWVDDSEGNITYYFPSIWKSNLAQNANSINS